MYYTYARGQNGERFLVPFLLGGLAGGAVAGLSQPRPVFVTSPYPQPMPQPMPMNPAPMYGGYPNGYYSSSTVYHY